jgi:hypothetical protein
MNNEQKLANNIAGVMDMWIDWYTMAPMDSTMTDEKLLKCMVRHYQRLKNEMVGIIDSPTDLTSEYFDGMKE